MAENQYNLVDKSKQHYHSLDDTCYMTHKVLVYKDSLVFLQVVVGEVVVDMQIKDFH